jgi:hypothetical protein
VSFSSWAKAVLAYCVCWLLVLIVILGSRVVDVCVCVCVLLTNQSTYFDHLNFNYKSFNLRTHGSVFSFCYSIGREILVIPCVSRDIEGFWKDPQPGVRWLGQTAIWKPKPYGFFRHHSEYYRSRLQWVEWTPTWSMYFNYSSSAWDSCQ